MDAKECMKILRGIKDIAFATVSEDNKPQIRIIDVMLAEGDRMYFLTARGKEFYRELMKTGQVAATALTRDYQMIRVSGRAVKLTEQKKWIDRMFEENPSMNVVYPGAARYVLEPFCIDKGEVEYFDLGKSPIFRQTYPIGGGRVKETGYEISEKCVRCGECEKICPQHCIETGEVYRIRQEHCLHCGLCAENCPAGAVIRKGEEI